MSGQNLKTDFLVSEDSNGGGGGGNAQIDNIFSGWALVRTGVEFSSYYGTYLKMFNKDRTVRLAGNTASPGGGTINTQIQRIDPETLAVTSILSTGAFNLGIAYPNTGQYDNIAVIAPDDDYILSVTGTSIQRTNVFANYTFNGTPRTIFNDSTRSWAIPVIIDNTHFASFSGTENTMLRVFVYDDTNDATIEKEFDVGFAIGAFSYANGKLIVIGQNNIKIIDVASESVIYDNMFTPILSDVVVLDNYAFVSTVSDTTTPVIYFDLSASTMLAVVPATQGTILEGSRKSGIAIVKDDNQTDDAYILAYHSNNGINLMLSVDVTAGIVKSGTVGGNGLIYTPQTIRPVVISGNRIVYYSSYSGTPGQLQTVIFQYKNTIISFTMKGDTYKIVQIGV
jgi:hypothetical protein